MPLNELNIYLYIFSPATRILVMHILKRCKPWNNFLLACRVYICILFFRHLKFFTFKAILLNWYLILYNITPNNFFLVKASPDQNASSSTHPDPRGNLLSRVMPNCHFSYETKLNLHWILPMKYLIVNNNKEINFRQTF